MTLMVYAVMVCVFIILQHIPTYEIIHCTAFSVIPAAAICIHLNVYVHITKLHFLTSYNFYYFSFELYILELYIFLCSTFFLPHPLLTFYRGPHAFNLLR